MIRNLYKNRPYRYRVRSLIATGKIKPEILYISEVEAKATLKAKGYKVRQIKKIRLLKHQVCISYWNEQGGVCSGFFSYRIFNCWHRTVEDLICGCLTLKTWQILNWIMRCELNYYPYPIEISISLNGSLQRRFWELQTSTVASNIPHPEVMAI
ncbi:MAG: hypothetical protein QNJ36_06090 [Calothrix sp. MO_167.B42]|nr:hypothetical protein [Calothrix sp. MO_167.B42]